MISIENLHFTYDIQNAFGLYDINLEFKAGEIVALLGPNGSGKTTLLKCLYGALKPHAGVIYLNGKNLLEFKSSELARHVGGVPQSHIPSFPFKSIDVVVMGRTPHTSIFSSPSERDYEKAREFFEELGIAELTERPYTHISGGERQLVFVARALMQEPKVLLLDEPTAHLDIKNRVKVLRAVKRIAGKGEITVVMSLHDPNEAMLFSNKILLLKNGKVQAYGPPREVISEEVLRNLYGEDFNIFTAGNRKIVVYDIQ